MADTARTVRSIGRWSLAALVLNGIIGSGVFALPGTVAERLGWLSLLAFVAAALLAGAIILCFAEVSSRFDRAGGPYLYAQEAFGRFAGLQMAWMSYFVRVASAAVQVNLLTVYLAEFWPPASTRVGGAVVSAVLLGFLAFVNVRGVRAGAGMSNLFAVAKIVPLLIFALLGVLWVVQGKTVAAPIPTTDTAGGWLQVLLLLMFSYGGFEAALVPLGESKDPRRDAPFALLVGLGTVVVIYLLVQVTVLATLAEPGASDRPLAAAARVLLGGSGAVFMTLAALISVYGWGASNMLNVPRLTMAMSERGDLPGFFGKIHPRFHTPYVSILVFAGLVFLLSLQGNLLQNITLSTVSRLLTYGLICAAVPVFRRWDSTAPGRIEPAAFRMPAGYLIAGIGILTSLVLVTRMNGREAVWLGVMILIGAIHWVVVRGRPEREATSAPPVTPPPGA
ncbi:MAG TPA: APC family permease [Gemmatimonadales bacterium]|nr:APC family permease [Gemmatimonadales bacterium]